MVFLPQCPSLEEPHEQPLNQEMSAWLPFRKLRLHNGTNKLFLNEYDGEEKR